MGKNGTDWENFYFNGATTAQITNNTHDDWYPQIANADDNGAYIAWHATVKTCGTLVQTRHGSPAGSLACFLLFAAPPLGWLRLQKRKMQSRLRASA